MFARLGAFAYRRRWLVVAAWLVVFLTAAPLVPQLPGLLTPGGFTYGNLEAERTHELLGRELGLRPSSLVVLFTRRGDSASDPRPLDVAAVAAAADKLRAAPHVVGVVSPLANPRQVSADGRTAYAVVSYDVPPEELPESVPEAQRLADGAIAEPSVEVIVAGGAVAYLDIQEVSERDLRRAELISLPLALVALLLVFGSVIAAGLPVLVGGLSVGVALGVLSLLARSTDLSIFVLNLTTMLGLGLGTDYSLFIVSRFREELARLDANGESDGAVAAAIERTMATAGRAVLFSGLTVFIGLLGLMTFGIMMLRSLGIGGAIVVGTSVLAALTLLPAALAILGRRVDSWTLWRRARVDDRQRFWASLARVVMARPVVVLILVLGLLLAVGSPFLRARFSLPDTSVLPPDVASRRSDDIIRRDFGPGEFSPILVAVQAPADILAPERLDALYDLARYLERDPAVRRVESIVSLDPRLSREQYHLLYRDGARYADAYARGALGASTRSTLTLVSVIPRHASVAPETRDLVARIRSLRPGADLSLMVGGGPAAIGDLVDQMYRDFPRAVLFIVVTTYLTLLVLFRSVVLPLKAVIMNALSLVASYGALVVVFQEGFLSGVLGFSPLGFVEATLPIIMFCLLFGLSMDYEVFLLTRVKEAYDLLGDNTESVAVGLERSGRVITNAALIVVVVSASFVTADVILIKAVGLGTAIAVLLDATVVRALLVPATMRLLGNLNWWAPRSVLRLLPRIASE